MPASVPTQDELASALKAADLRLAALDAAVAALAARVAKLEQPGSTAGYADTYSNTYAN